MYQRFVYKVIKRECVICATCISCIYYALECINLLCIFLLTQSSPVFLSVCLSVFLSVLSLDLDVYVSFFLLVFLHVTEERKRRRRNVCLKCSVTVLVCCWVWECFCRV